MNSLAWLSLISFIGSTICEKLIWSDEFDVLDESKWSHLVTTYPLEDFQYYRNNRANSWVSDGHLNIMPTPTAMEYGEDFLYTGTLDLFTEDPDHPCNIAWSQDTLCKDKAGADIVKPIQLARLETKHKFSFRYGRVKVRASLPLASWIRPAIWLMPEDNTYGGFPASGEIDLMESSGNENYHCGQQSRGVDTVQTNLHFGPAGINPHWKNETLKSNSSANYAEQFHIYEIDWTEQYLAFLIDGSEIYRLTAPGPDGGLWHYAGYSGDNIYKHGGPLAPFDQPFYFILSAQSGGWPFYERCEPPAPWGDNSNTKRREFWENSEEWFYTWKRPFRIDYIRVYQ